MGLFEEVNEVINTKPRRVPVSVFNKCQPIQWLLPLLLFFQRFSSRCNDAPRGLTSSLGGCTPWNVNQTSSTFSFYISGFSLRFTLRKGSQRFFKTFEDFWLNTSPPSSHQIRSFPRPSTILTPSSSEAGHPWCSKQPCPWKTFPLENISWHQVLKIFLPFTPRVLVLAFEETNDESNSFFWEAISDR